MKKFLMAAIATTTMATAAHAGSINLDTRIDHSNVDMNDAAVAKKAASHADYSKIYFRVARLDFQGALNQDSTTTYRIRYNLLSNGAATSRDGAGSHLQLGFVAHKMGDATITLGKFVSEIGGFEGISNGSDMYLQSEYYTNAFNGVAMDSKIQGVSAVLHIAGAKVDYAVVPGHTLTAIVADPFTADNANSAGAFAQTAMAYGLVYKGSLMEKSLSLMASYHVNPGASFDDKNTFTTVGAKWTSGAITAQVDMNTQQADYKTNATTSKVSKLVTTAAKVGYTVDQWTGRFEYHTSTNDFFSTTDKSDSYTGMGLVAEYKPRTDNNFRYHVAYNSITGSGSSYAAGDVTRTEIIVGTRLMADFLK